MSRVDWGEGTSGKEWTTPPYASCHGDARGQAIVEPGSARHAFVTSRLADHEKISGSWLCKKTGLMMPNSCVSVPLLCFKLGVFEDGCLVRLGIG